MEYFSRQENDSGWYNTLINPKISGKLFVMARILCSCVSL